MSSNSTKSLNAPTATSTSSFKMPSIPPGMTGIVIFTIIAISMFIASFVTMSNFIGSKDDWNIIKPQITKIIGYTLAGTVGLIIASFMYYIQDPQKTMYFILVLTCLSLGLSFSSLAISAISR
jgi:hypothetical protein